MNPGCLLGIALGLLLRYRNRRREAREQRLVAPSQWFTAVWFFVGLPALVVVSLIAAGEAPAFHWTYPLAALVLFPNLWIRLLVQPFGAIRWIYRFSLLANFTWTLRPKTGALCAALLARMKHTEPFGSLPIDRWLVDRSKPPQGILLSTDLLADALLSDLRGDRRRTRFLMETILRFPSKACGRKDAQLAHEWLLLQAAEKGHWYRIPLIHRGARWTRLGAFLRQISLALTDDGDPQSAEHPSWKRRARRLMLGLTWILAPRPWATRPLLLRAQQHLEPSTELLTEAEASVESPAHEPTLEAMAHTVRATDPTATASAWRKVMSSTDFAAWVESRCEALGIDPGAATQAIYESVADSWQELSETTGLALDPEVAQGWLHDQQAHRLSSLEESAEALNQLGEDDEEILEPIHHLEAWLAFCRRFDEALQAGAALSLTFYQVRVAVWNGSAELYNTQGQKALAHSMFAWLHDHAVAIGDSHTAEQMRAHMKLAV